MADKKFTIPHDSVWKRPDQAYFDYQSEANGHSLEEIEYDGKYKTIREKRDLSIFGLTLYGYSGQILYVQMNTQSDSPDGFLMTPDEKEVLTHNIAAVEMTFYGRNKLGLPDKSLEDKLSEKGGKFQKLPDNYWLLVHIGIGLKVNHQEVASKLHSLKPKFLVFSIQEICGSPDTINRFVVYEPKPKIYDINIGEACYKLSKSKLPGTVNQRHGKPKQ